MVYESFPTADDFNSEITESAIKIPQVLKKTLINHYVEI